MSAKVIRMDEFKKEHRAATFENVYLSWALAAMSFTFLGIVYVGMMYANRQISAKR